MLTIRVPGLIEATRENEKAAYERGCTWNSLVREVHFGKVSLLDQLRSFAGIFLLEHCEDSLSDPVRIREKMASSTVCHEAKLISFCADLPTSRWNPASLVGFQIFVV